MKLEDGELITLDDNSSYLVVKTIECNKINYLLLMTTVKPTEILIAKEEMVSGEVEIVPVDDVDEAKYVLSVFTNA
jgi:hypothetical protein